MAAEGDKKASKKDEMKRQSQEQGIVDGFNQLRQEQRTLTDNAGRARDRIYNEHNLVGRGIAEGGRRPPSVTGSGGRSDSLRGPLEDHPASCHAEQKTILQSTVEALNDRNRQERGRKVNEYREKAQPSKSGCLPMQHPSHSQATSLRHNLRQGCWSEGRFWVFTTYLSSPVRLS
uniref:Uncharacterized protein n=1 Tax=Ixodes ricinus TaxID=34613 RepID=V5IF35_IXORI